MRFVSLDFLLPEVCIRLGQLEVFTALMPMPKTTVDKHTRAILVQHDIGMARQTRAIQTVSKALAPQIFTHKHLRLRVRRANRSHILVSLLWCELIHNAKLLKNWFAYILLNIFLQLLWLQSNKKL